MATGAWELKAQRQVLVGILHTDQTTIAWSFGLRNLIVPGHITGVSGQPYDMGRNSMCQATLQGGFEWCFMLDSDVVCPPDTILRLMSRQQPIISGVYYRRSPPHGIPVALRRNKDESVRWLTHEEAHPSNGVVEVDLVGAGCFLIHRSVLEKFLTKPLAPGNPWFHWRANQHGILPPGECLSEDFAFCFPGGTWIIGPSVKRLANVVVGDRVLNHCGATKLVLAASKRFYSGEMVRITSSYMREVEATPGHKFYVRTKVLTGRTQEVHAKGIDGVGRNILLPVKVKVTDWVEAGDIKEGDWLYVPKTNKWKTHNPVRISVANLINMEGVVIGHRKRLRYKITRKEALKVSGRISVTPELCRLLGYYIAEGHSGKNNHVVSMSFNMKEQDYVDDCSALLTNIFGAKVSTATGGGATNVFTSSKILGQLFTALCGKGSFNKHLPYFWSNLDRNCLSELINGYWRGDGSCGRKIFSMSTRSEQLAREVQAALLRLGMLGGVRATKNGKSIAYTIGIPSSHAERFADISGYQDYDKSLGNQDRRYFLETDTHFLVKVTKVEKFGYDGEVYNLKVAGKETYTANGVSVHNCQHAQRLGYKITLDTGVQCRHIGLSEAGPGTLLPAEVRT